MNPLRILFFAPTPRPSAGAYLCCKLVHTAQQLVSGGVPLLASRPALRPHLLPGPRTGEDGQVNLGQQLHSPSTIDGDAALVMSKQTGIDEAG
jgi:hypothetical protein